MASSNLSLGEYLIFRLGDKEYGIDILHIQEVRSYEQSTRVANAPAFIKGVVNLRGVIVPIIDLRPKLGCESAGYDAFTAVIVLDIRDRIIGIVVDSVSDVIELDPEAISSAPKAGDDSTRFIIGIGMVSVGEGKVSTERYVRILDIEGLLTDAGTGLFST